MRCKANERKKNIPKLAGVGTITHEVYRNPMNNHEHYGTNIQTQYHI